MDALEGLSEGSDDDSSSSESGGGSGAGSGSGAEGEREDGSSKKQKAADGKAVPAKKKQVCSDLSTLSTVCEWARRCCGGGCETGARQVRADACGAHHTGAHLVFDTPKHARELQTHGQLRTQELTLDDLEAQGFSTGPSVLFIKPPEEEQQNWNWWVRRGPLCVRTGQQHGCSQRVMARQAANRGCMHAVGGVAQCARQAGLKSRPVWPVELMQPPVAGPE